MSVPPCPAVEEGGCSLFSPTVTLLSLSDEVLLLIMSHLPPLSLYHCSLTTSRLARLTEDKRLVANLSFRRAKGFTPLVLKGFLSPGPRLTNIMKLNLNSAYWLPAGLVTDCVARLKNLTDLHIVDIRLTAKQLVSVLSRLTLLRQLSLTWCYTSKKEVQELTSSTLEPSWSRLEGLSVHLPPDQIEQVGGGGLDLLTWALALCTNLEQLTVFTDHIEQTSNDNGRYNLTVNTRPMSFPCLKSLVLILTSLPVLLVTNFKQRVSEAVTSFQLNQVKCTDFLAKLSNSTGFFLIGDKIRWEMRSELGKYLTENSKVAQKIHSYLNPADVEPLVSTPLPSLTELSVQCWRFSNNTIKNLLNKKDWGNLKRLALTTDRYCGSHESTQVIHQLVESDFPHLVSLTLPLCCLLEFEKKEVLDKMENRQVGIKQRMAHADSSKQTSNKGVLLLPQRCPQLRHLEVIGHDARSCDSCQLMRGDKLLEALPNFVKLRTLIVHNIHVVNFTPSQTLFLPIFRACKNLAELYISHLGNSCQKLVRDLALGLEVTQSLTLLRVQQNQLTQFSPSLLASLTKGCPSLDQLVLVDSSQSHTLPQYPVTQLIDMVKTKNLSLLCVFSRLLTIEKIKKLKAGLKKHAKCSPHFLSCFSRADNKNIPGVFLKTIFSLYNKISENIASGHGVQFDEIF